MTWYMFIRGCENAGMGEFNSGKVQLRISRRANEEVRFEVDLKVGISKVPETGKTGQFRERGQPVL